MDTDREWERWGACEPYFGVITHPDFRHQNLNDAAKERFFASGQAHAEHVIRVCRERLDPSFQPRSALDFGCGVGRVALALASLCESVLGLDVSASMLRVAEENRLERGKTNVAFRLSDDSLAAVEGTFDFIHSFIVFQHLDVARARNVFATLIDKLAPRGIFVAHFTYAKARYPGSFGRAPVAEPAHAASAEADATRDPVMLMNSFDVNELFFVMQSRGCGNFFTEFTDHGGEWGVLLYFQRDLAAAAAASAVPAS